MTNPNRDDSLPEVLIPPSPTRRSRSTSKFKHFFKHFLEPNIGAALIAVAGSFLVWHLNNIRYQKELVTSYIESVQVLLLNEYHESGKKDPEITLEHIELFIKSKAGTTLQDLENKKVRDTLLSFLRQVKIGFRPRDESQFKQLTPDEKDLLTLLKGINLSHANLNYSDFAFALLPDADLAGASLIETKLSKADLQKSYLGEADLRGAVLKGADFREAKLRGAKFGNSPIRINENINFLQISSWTWPLITGKKQTNLYEAKLEKAILTEANLEKAILTEANLEKAILTEANLAQANLAQVKNLTPSQIKSACNWQQASYKAKYNEQEKRWVTLEPHNEKFIEDLKNDKSSDPEQPVDCSKWN